ncbi:MAG: AAA family ATPase [Desulfobulbaceae bacterium]|nr:AAA family ATPase [Desulfobulbaceae bacterium]HIJ91415.1 AAA family ATPase [Deltaproteobacteria bacterium]
MRITRLELKAFGPFTDRTLEFGPGLHIVHGPNEAGKSSTLRALKAWLFGFPERTHDNFLHANEQLLVGGCLESEDGRELAFYRRKKRKADILDPEGNPLETAALAAFLPIAEQAVFESLHGLSHEDLIRGGEDILAQKGEVGQALFSAGAGISSLRGVLAGLESEADVLFLARGKREINEAVAAYKDTQKIVREATLSSRDWHELNNGLAEAQKSLRAIEARHGEKDKRRRQLERILLLLPQLALRNVLRRQLADLGEVVVVPDDFSTRRQECERALHSLTRREADLALKHAQREKMIEPSPYQMVLDAEEAIEDLHQRLGGYNTAREDLPKREGMRISSKREAAEFLRMVRQDISLDQVEHLRPVSGRRKIIGHLATRHEGLQQGLAQTEKDLRDIQREIGEIEGELALLPQARDAAGLNQACRIARKGGAIDEDLAAKARQVEEKKRTCMQTVDRLALWSGGLEQFLSLRLPLVETVRKYESAFQVHEMRQRDIHKERERLLKNLAKVQADIRRHETSGSTPTEEELVLIRNQRDRGWELLRRQWLAGEDLAGEDVAFGKDLPLPEAYEKKVALADTVADRLRHEADRVQAFAALRTEQQSLNEALADLEKDATRNNLAFTALDTEWRTLWQLCAVTPLAPQEMLAWLGEAAALRHSADELQSNERELARKSGERQELKIALTRALEALSEEIPAETDELDPLLLHGETLLSHLSALEDKRRRLLEKRSDLQREAVLMKGKQAGFSQDMSAWRLEWREVVADLGGEREIHPAEAGDLLDNLHSCFAKLKEAEDLQKRIDGMTRDTSRFEEASQALAQKIAPGLMGQPAGQIVAQLKDLLKKARKDITLRTQHLKEVEEAAEMARLLAGEREDLEHRLAELCRLAGRVLPEELETAEKRSAQYRSLADRLLQTENTLIEGAGGLSLAELEAQAGKIDPDELPAEIARLSQEIEQELAPEGKHLSELIGEKRTRLRQMDGNAKAAEAAEQGARLLARLRRLSERYIQLKVAGYVLKSEIERFRSENQTPVLTITSRYFSELTLGSFSGLLTDENDQGEPVLVGVRPNGARVLVERMSSGTRDQLYLALRLASLEWRLAGRHEPMPFILDDILVNADDARSRAALKILGGLAAKTQVILFTHHRRIVEEALRQAAVSQLQVHELGA